jgi:hypothetical protein
MARIGKLVLQALSPRTVRHFEEAADRPMAEQEQLLHQVMTANADTAYGRQCGFRDIHDLATFQKAVPLATYESLEPFITAAMDGAPKQLTKETPVLFATTSGTTGTSKFIPVTPAGRKAKAHLMLVWMCALYLHHPELSNGRIMSMVSPEVESYAPCGTPCGAESGHVYRNIPKAMQYMYSAPYEVFEIKDYEARYYTLLRLAAGQDVGTVSSANPSTVLLLAQRLAANTESIIRDVRDGTLAVEAEVDDRILSKLQRELRPARERARELEIAAGASGALRLDTAWPNLSVITCWKGGTVGSYLEHFQ